ncbi:hypothetical protein AB0N88_30105 [Streptomyces sp. NPDC093516]|uniref:hypothetical protein n=1 Tax=Streptomyces sp. NPDC093516 TaxID=3155304 RepID=UPI00342E35FB
MSPSPVPPPAAPSGGAVPGGLPRPGRFAHLHPDDGACLMEVAALLAGDRFGDSPAGTHPALAELARAVNDNVGDSARLDLWPLAAELASARPAERAYAPLLVGTALEAARRVRPGSRLLSRHSRACRRRARRLGSSRAAGPVARLADLLWWRGPGSRRLDRAVRVLSAASDADRHLSALLRQAVARARESSTDPHAEYHPMNVN